MSQDRSYRYLGAREGLWAGGLSLVILLGMVYLGSPNKLDQFIYDAYLNGVKPAVDAHVAIVAIDSKSLHELGQWPWSRDMHGKIVERMTQVGAKAIAFDIAISEPSTMDKPGDAHLAHAIEANGKVVLPVYPESLTQRAGVTDALPLETLRQVAKLGHADVEIESDGVNRGVYLKGGTGEAKYPTLALAAVEAADGVRPASYIGERNLHERQARSFNWVRDYHVLIPFAGAPGTVPHYSVADVLRDDAVAGTLAGKYVLVGVTAEGLRSAFVTPMSAGTSLMSGVEYHANVLNAILQGRLIEPVEFPLPLILAVLSLLIPVLIYPRVGVRKAWWIFLGLFISFLITCFAMLRANLWMPPSPVLVTLTTGFGLWGWRRFEGTSKALQREQERARVTLMSVGDGVLTTDLAWHVCYMNPACQTLLGSRSHGARGKSLHQLLRFENPKDKQRLDEALERCAQSRETVRPNDPFVLSGSGSRRSAVTISVSPISADDAHEERFVIAFGDVTDSVAMAEQIIHQATHDALTGLPNRLLLTDRIRQSITAAQRNEESVAVLFLDLDGFKRVNDTLGHTQGDNLLKEVAARLTSRRRVSDTVARWGGDEFVVLLRDLIREESILGPVRDIQSSLALPFQMGDHELHVSASIGIAVFPKDGADAETLLQHADIAMYRAKREGRNQLHFYSERINDWSRRQLEIEGQLHHALKNNELVVHYQPQLSLVNGAIAGVEALVRWLHPEKGLMFPNSFLPVAEESNLIEAISERVMQKAFLQARQWELTDIGSVTVSVNFSARQFLRRDLLAEIDRVLDETGANPRQIKVEVTETLVLIDSSEVKSTLKAIRERGIRLVLDDFGTGYSSLNYLKGFPLDELKIDKSFTRDIVSRPQDAAITEALITLAHKMDMTVVAEGVETLSQMELLRHQGCDQVQGFYLSPSVAADAIPGVFKRIAASWGNTNLSWLALGGNH